MTLRLIQISVHCIHVNSRSEPCTLTHNMHMCSEHILGGCHRLNLKILAIIFLEYKYFHSRLRKHAPIFKFKATYKYIIVITQTVVSFLIKNYIHIHMCSHMCMYTQIYMRRKRICTYIWIYPWHYYWCNKSMEWFYRQVATQSHNEFLNCQYSHITQGLIISRCWRRSRTWSIWCSIFLQCC